MTPAQTAAQAAPPAGAASPRVPGEPLFLACGHSREALLPVREGQFVYCYDCGAIRGQTDPADYTPAQRHELAAWRYARAVEARRALQDRVTVAEREEAEAAAALAELEAGPGIPAPVKLDGCTCPAIAGTHRPWCAWSAVRERAR